VICPSILIVDDNKSNVKLMEATLNCGLYEVRTAMDAEDAIKVLETFAPRLILMDLQLPGMDGLTLTRLLKQDPARRHIIVLALTAYAMKGDEEKAIAAGCDGYITEPIDAFAAQTDRAPFREGAGNGGRRQPVEIGRNVEREQPRWVQETGDTYFAEPLSAWLQLARAAKALHETVAHLRQQQRPRRADLRTLAATRFGVGKGSKHFRTLADAEAEPERDRNSSWFLVGERLNEWLVGAPVRFFCEIEENRGKFDLDFVVGDGLGIFPVVAAQLVATLSDPERGKAVI
jgi:CheY-like chemotaxis protein